MTTDPNTDLRQRIAEAVERLHETGGLYALDAGEPERIADAVLTVLPPPADRAAVYREAAEAVAAHPGPIPYRPQLNEDGGFWWDTRDRDAVVNLLRRLADEAPQSEPPVHGESVAHLAGLHDDEPAADARQDGAQQ